MQYSTPVFQRGQIDTMHCDISKALSVVSHILVMHELTNIDYAASVVNLLHRYLLDRSFYLMVNDETSCLYQAACLVPQVSVTDPLLFLIYANDVCFVIRFSFVCL
uniref:Rte ele1 n=1 Tax=Rhipicephalus appendiculatus TaxID=34631 RepID=A0A131YYP3_RHIAP